MKIKRALISVSNKTGIVEFAKSLEKFNIEIISTGGTYKVLKEAGINVKEISEYTDFPEMMDGRIKTLHPKVHGGILSIRDNPDHVAAMERYGILPIDLVVVNLYPFIEASSKGLKRSEVIEQIDIGGPAMVRAAAKNHKYVTVIVDPNEYDFVINEMKSNDGDISEGTRKRLAMLAFKHTALYDAAIASWLANMDNDKTLPSIFGVFGDKKEDLRYGENPHQSSALYVFPDIGGESIANARKLWGKELSFNNYLDMDSAYSLVREFGDHACAVIKHNNPCGCGIGMSQEEALVKALDGDPMSAYGGIVAVNKRLEGKSAKILVEKAGFIECIVAPYFDEKAVDILKSAKWGKNVRIVEVGKYSNDFKQNFDIKVLLGGFLVQDMDLPGLGDPDFRTVTTRPPDEKEREDLFFAWHVVKHVKSNGIVIARDRMAVGIGAGQMSRVDAVDIAIRKAGKRAEGAVLASDGFFPFPDSIEIAKKAGITALIEPGGSKRDKEVIEAADKFNMALIFTGVRHFKH